MSPRARRDIVRPRLLSSGLGRPLNFTVRRRMCRNIPQLAEVNMRVTLVIMLSCLSAEASAAAPDDEFVAAWNEGQHNERSTADGAAYVHGMVRWLGPALTESNRQCSDKPKDTTQPARLVVQLNLDGSVRPRGFSRTTSSAIR